MSEESEHSRYDGPTIGELERMRDETPILLPSDKFLVHMSDEEREKMIDVHGDDVEEYLDALDEMNDYVENVFLNVFGEGGELEEQHR